jgi:hypothetical protein
MPRRRQKALPAQTSRRISGAPYDGISISSRNSARFLYAGWHFSCEVWARTSGNIGILTMHLFRLGSNRIDRGAIRLRSIVSRAVAFATLLVCQTWFAPAAAAQTLATIHLTPGWATFGQALPQGAAPSGVRVGTFPTQTDVKNRWPDGSIRFAVISVFVPAAGNFPLEPTAIATGTFTPALPATSVTLTIAGVTYTATQPQTPSADRWLSGPLAYEGRSVVTPVAAGAIPHPFLRVNFDTRVYNDAQARVDVSVENVLDQAGAATVTYDVAIAVNGAPVFTKTAVSHYYLTRWRKIFSVSGTTLSAITPDLVPFNTSKALPQYLPVVANFVNTAGANYDILQSGALDQDMSLHGGRSELAPYPDWTARYLVHKDPAQRAFVLANGDLSGSWPIHARESGALSGLGAERLISLDQRPTIWFDERAQAALQWDYIKGLPLPIREYTGIVPSGGQSALVPDNAHQPSLAFVPYLMTGDRYYAEEMAFWADYAMLRTYPGDGVRGAAGIVENNEVRGWGWALRNIADAAAYYPDASPVKAYLVQKVANNLQYLDTFANAAFSPSNPFNVLFINRRPDGGQYISLWEQSYLAHAIDRANQHGFSGGLLARDAVAKFHLRLFTSEPDYPKVQAGAYLIAVGTANPTSPALLGTFFTSMAQIWSATQGQERPFPGFYGPEARLNLILGIQNGFAGAQGAYDYLLPFIAQTPTFCPNQPDMPDLACRAGWAIAVPSTTAAPVPARIVSPVPGSDLLSTTVTFNWDAGVGATSYQLTIGSTPGGNDMYSGAATTTQSALVSGLPSAGEPVWARLASNIGGTWQSVDYQFAAVNVTKVTPTLTWTAPAPIPYGTLLGGAQLNATASVPGTFTYTPAAGTVLTVGSQTLSVSFTPTDAVNYARATAATTLTVTRATPAIIWSDPPAITAGAALGSTQLNATSSVPGTFAYSPAAGTILGVGTAWPLSVTFTPTDTTLYVATTTTVTIAVVKATPVITWPVPADIVYPALLGGVQLNARANVAGSFSYDKPAGTVLAAGNGQTITVTFTPTDGATYNTATATVTINVANGTPTVTWNTPATVTLPATLSATQLNATASVPGSFVYNPAAGVVLTSGPRTLSVTFTPTDGSYAPLTKTVTVNAVRATPTITWAAPASITSAVGLSSTQLNATASVPGSFNYLPTTGALLSVGPRVLTATFTPTDTANYNNATASVPITVTAPAGGATPTPVKIGSNISGTFNDATGHSGQSHLVFAPNANVWWLFTLTSVHDALNDRTVQAYVSSGPDLATATWTPAASSPTLGNAGGATNSLFAGGRSMSVALRTIGTTDYVHVFASAAFDGQVSSNGHIRAQLGASSIAWQGPWNNPGAPNAASEWNGPAGTGGSGLATNMAWGTAVGISTGGFIHHFGTTMDQEVDCSVGRSTNADTSTTWTNGFGNNVSPTGNVGTSPPWTTAVIDKTMFNQCKVLAFAPLASDVMLAVYGNGGSSTVPQPNITNIRYTKSGAGGTWTNIPSNGGGGNGNVFVGDATINENDWTLVPVSLTQIYVFRRSTTGVVEGRSYVAGTTTWSNLTAAPPGFSANQSMKPAGTGAVSSGLFSATDGTNVWLFVISGGTTNNSILFTKFNGSSWTPWATVPGTDALGHSMNFIAGYAKVSNNQIGLIWTETGGTGIDVLTTSLSLNGGVTAPPGTATITAPANSATLSGTTVTVSATATAGSGSVAGVQFYLDGAPFGAEDTSSPFSITWSTTSVTNGTHFLAAVVRDTSGGLGSSPTIMVTTSNDFNVPIVAITSPSAGVTVTSGTSVTVSADASDDIGVVGVQFLLDGVALGAEDTVAPYTLTWDTTTVARGPHTLSARARDASGKTTTSAVVSVTIKLQATITWPTPAAIAYPAALSATQLNATANAPGTFTYTPALGTVLLAGTRTLSVVFTPTDPTLVLPATATVTINVTDATVPTLTVPPNTTLEATGPSGTPFAFVATATDPLDGPLPVSCAPGSGFLFAFALPGPTTTPVTCTAVDVNGNSRSATFNVKVQDTLPPTVIAPAAISVSAVFIDGTIRGNVTDSAGSQAIAALLSGATAIDLRDPAPTKLAAQVVLAGASAPVPVDNTTTFPLGTSVVTFRYQDSLALLGTGTASVTVTPRTAEPATIVEAARLGGVRLRAEQNLDGGWPFQVGSNVCGTAAASCTNTIGTTGLGLLAAYVRFNDGATLAAAMKAGDLLVTRANLALAQATPPSPVSRDIEFLAALANLAQDPAKKLAYTNAARDWFNVTVTKFPVAADQIDSYLTKRNQQGLRSLAAWDAASYIRAAKAVGATDRAIAAANSIVAREAEWKDKDPSHRFDRCANPAGCGQPGNLLSFDYTIIGTGSLLWGIHDLTGFDLTIAEYRDFLITQQDPAGSWDAGDLQMTSFVMMGLAAVGGPAANAAIVSAANYLLAHQFATPAAAIGGWPAEGSAADPANEFPEVDGEIVRAMATVFSTPTGANIAVVPSQLSTVIFSSVTSPGQTTVVAVDQATVPATSDGYEIVNSLTYEVATTAAISGDIIVCFTVPSINDPDAFAALRILHGENGVLVDRTILAPDQPAPDFATRQLCARTSSLSPFAIAAALPDVIAPVVTVPANASIAATGPLGAAYSYPASALDNVDGTLAATCTPAAGAMFPFGTTTVQCSATDAHGNTGSASFMVTVSDTTQPVITVPADADVAAVGAAGASHSFTASALDEVDGAVVVACTPASGSVFPLGTSTVACRATDSHGNASAATFAVTVRDTTPPVITVPVNLTRDATAPVAVIYTAAATDDVDGKVNAACAPASGSKFPVGTTTVTCTAADAAGNVASASFSVTVNVAPVATSSRYKLSANEPLTGILQASDANGDGLIYSVVTNGTRGTFVVDARTGAFTYVPDRRSTASDELTFRVTDGRLWSNSATVKISVNDEGGKR